MALNLTVWVRVSKRSGIEQEYTPPPKGMLGERANIEIRVELAASSPIFLIIPCNCCYSYSFGTRGTIPRHLLLKDMPRTGGTNKRLTSLFDRGLWAKLTPWSKRYNERELMAQRIYIHKHNQHVLG